MLDYTGYDATDFALDDSFRQWVLHGATGSVPFWDTWIQANPQRLDAVLAARALVSELHLAHHDLTDDEFEQAINRLVQARLTSDSTKSIFFRPAVAYWLKVAAVMVLVSLGGLLVYRVQSGQSVLYAERTQTTAWLVESRNDGSRPQLLTLPDGSHVWLQPGSRVSYPTTFVNNQRDVYVNGEAFFEVVRNPKKPFFVYADELVVRVLGTSFTVRAFDKEADLSVVVRTGKVSVFAHAANAPKETFGELAPDLILTPNQQAVFSRVRQELKKSLVNAPVPLAELTKESLSLHFDHTPVRTIFRQLEHLYGIPIVYDAERLANCELSADLGNEPLFDQMNLICKAINGRYETIDGQIVIYSQGCH